MSDDAPGDLSTVSSLVECQILTAFSHAHPKNGADFKEWVATYRITNKAKDIAGAGGDPLSWIIPASVDQLVLRGGLSASRVAVRTGAAEYSLFVKKGDFSACSVRSPGKMAVWP